MKQIGFITPLRVEAVDAVNWCLLEDFVFTGTKGDTFVCRQGMLTDFASVPWWTQFILPRTGTWTKAAVLHDKMCDEINDAYRINKTGAAGVIVQPTFTSIDTDALFRKNARDDGTDPIRSELLWMGVRLGALRNPARRANWFSTAPRVIGDVVLVVALIAAIVYGIYWIGAHI